MGPAFSFDADARRAMQAMVEHGYVDGLSWPGTRWPPTTWKAPCSTRLWGRISTRRDPIPNGHYNHLDVINRVRKSGLHRPVLLKTITLTTESCTAV